MARVASWHLGHRNKGAITTMSGILREFIKDEIEEERKKAVLEVKKSMAVNLSAQGVDIEIISKAAEVSKDTVEEWLERHRGCDVHRGQKD